MQSENNFIAGSNGNQLYLKTWFPTTNEVKAIVVLVHGLGEHCGRYQNLLEVLLPMGFAVYAIDHHGHGQSGGLRVYTNRFGRFVDDVDMVVERAKKQHPECPIYMIGHSMGGLIASQYLLRFQSKLAGAVLSAPAIKPPTQISPLLIKLGKYIAAIAPKLRAVPLDISGLSRDPKVIEQYMADPLVHSGNVTAGLSRQIQLAMEEVERSAHTIQCPLLVLQGSQDRLVNPLGAKALVSLATSADKTLLEYQGLYHELFNEPEKEQVLSDVSIWLENQLETSP
jgi:alpha-beta hydrolase superfamily lysophospholipase